MTIQTKKNIIQLKNVFTRALRSFIYHKGIIRATALAFDSAIAFIPVVIIISAIANLFGVINLLAKILPEINAVLNLNLPLDGILALISHAEKLRFQSLGFLGFTTLFFTFWFAMGTLEESMNMVWQIRKSRSPLKKILAYTPVLIFALLSLLIISFFMFNVQTEMQHFITTIPTVQNFQNALYLGTYNIFFAGLTWVTLNLVYLHMPNTKVPFLSGLFASSFTTLLIFIFLGAALKLQGLLMVRYSILYGSLAILPLLMLLILGLWVIILMGNEISYQISVLLNRKKRLAELMQARKKKILA